MSNQYTMGCVYASPEMMENREQNTQPSLILENGDIVPLTKLSVSIGRNNTCDVVVDDPSVSRTHAHLYNRLGQWVLFDNDSSNGTQINNTPIFRGMQYPLHDGDVILLGCKVSLTFRDLSSGFSQDAPYPYIHAEPVRMSTEDYMERGTMGCVYAAPQMMEREQHKSFWARLFKRKGSL